MKYIKTLLMIAGLQMMQETGYPHIKHRDIDHHILPQDKLVHILNH